MKPHYLKTIQLDYYYLNSNAYKEVKYEDSLEMLFFLLDMWRRAE